MTAVIKQIVFAIGLCCLVHAQAKIPSDYPRYEIIDLGTFGGPNGNASANAVIISPRGTVTSAADTPKQLNCKKHPVNQFDCFQIHAYQFKDGMLQDLGTLGGSDSFGFWINDRDEVAGVSEDGSFNRKGGFYNERATLWRNGAVIDLGTFGGPQSFALSVNNHGQVAGGANTSTDDTFSLSLGGFFPTTKQTHAFLWQNGVMQDLGTLGGPDALGIFVNERGQVAGVSFTDDRARPGLGTPPVHGFVWTRGKMHDIGTLGGNVSSISFFNNKGQAAGSANLAGDQVSHAIVWERGILRDLGTLGGRSSTAFWISEEGQVVGQANLKGDANSHAFSWQRGKKRDLGTLPGDQCSFASVVNSSGEISGISSDCTFSKPRGFYMKRGGPMVDLASLIVRGPTITPLFPLFLSENGNIALLGKLPTGELRLTLVRRVEHDQD